MHTSPFGAAAIGQVPLTRIGTNADGANAYIDASGQVPSFPSYETLERGTFKVVVMSTTRVNRAVTTSSDFSVDVAAYAPRNSPVTRVQLVDVDIPPTQRLIEPPWSRLYFCQGVPLCADGRSVDAEVITNCETGAVATTATLVLPLLIDAVTVCECLPGGQAAVRLAFQHRAPYPIRAVAEVWQTLFHRTACGTCLQLVGVPGLTTPVSLTPDRVHDDTPFSIVVQSLELFSAVQAAQAGGHPVTPWLYAPLLPGPSALAWAVSVLASEALAPVVRVTATYSAHTDRFAMGFRCPAVGGCGMPAFSKRSACPGCDPPACDGEVTVVLAGVLMQYMGFNTPAVFQVPDGGAVNVDASSCRYQSPHAYAAVPVGSPVDGRQLARWTEGAMNVYAALSGVPPAAPRTFTVTTPVVGVAPAVATLPTGCMTLAEIAAGIVGLPVGVAVAVACAPAVPGLVFTCAGPTTGAAPFGLDFLADDSWDPSLIGYERRVYGPACRHVPAVPATHCPMSTCLSTAVPCTPPVANTSVFYRGDTGQLVFESSPFPAFAAVVVAVDADACTYLLDTAPYLHGLQPGAAVSVAIAGPPVAQQATVVTTVPSATSLIVVVSAPGGGPPLFAPTTAVTVIPQDAPALTLFMQTRGRVDAVNADTFGFEPRTYEGSCCAALTSPGCCVVCQDPFINIALAFSGPDAEPLTGDVYYPPSTHASARTIFAKIPRAGSLRADFDRVYDHTFRGSGTTLGYVRVRLTNPNGTLYQTHGQPASVTLRFDCRESYVGLGGGHNTTVFGATNGSGGGVSGTSAAAGAGAGGSDASHIGAGFRGGPVEVVPVGGGRSSVVIPAFARYGGPVVNSR